MSNQPMSMAECQEASHWDEDHRRALTHSHLRTLNALEEGDSDDGSAIVTARDPRATILPSVPSIAQQEQSSRTRTYSGGDEALEFVRPPILRMRGNTEIHTDEEGTMENDGERKSNDGGFGRKRLCMSLLVLILAVTTIITAFVGPSTRHSMTLGLFKMLKGGEAIMLPSNQQEQFIFGNSLAAILGDRVNFQINLDGLYTPNYFPVADTLPVLWLVPQSGNDVVLNVLQYCLRLTTASGMGANDQASNSLAVLTHPDRVAHYINVDTTTLLGLDRADRLSMVESGLANVMATPLLGHAAHLFASKLKTGRVFCILEHPVRRAVEAQYESMSENNPTVMTLVQYAESELLNENVLTKGLANVTMTDMVTLEHVRIAKVILEQYVVVGLADYMEESLEYFMEYFGWVPNVEDYMACQNSFVNNRKVAYINPASDEYSTLADRNWADMEVYEYAKTLFENRAKKTRINVAY